MKALALIFFMTLCATMGWAQSESETSPAPEQQLYEHYLSLKRMQESLSGHSLERQARLQPQIQRAERRACERIRKERREGVPREDYRREGGDEFLVFSRQLEQYCQTVH